MVALRRIVLFAIVAAAVLPARAQVLRDVEETKVRELLRDVLPGREPELEEILRRHLDLPPQLAFDAQYERALREIDCLQRADREVLALDTPGVYPVGDYLCVRELRLADGVTLELTSGDTVIAVRDRWTIAGTATLQRRKVAPLPPPLQPVRAGDGASHNPGPDTEGPGNGDAGAGGGHGGHGASGIAGASGSGNGCLNGQVEIRLGEEAVLSGMLVIEGRGSDGGRGGPGGDAGNGGNGQQGGRSVFKRTIFGIAYCDRGPGWGGTGGNGGNAGPGGGGGCGQSGLGVTIKSMTVNPYRGDANDFALARVDLSGGRPGAGGRPGLPGERGRGGFGGRGSTACRGEETTRRGGDGSVGNSATEGPCGAAGQNGVLQQRDGIALRVVRNATVAPPSACRPPVAGDCAAPRAPGSTAPPPRACAELQVIHGVWDALAETVGDLQSDELEVPGLACPVQFLSQRTAPAENSTPAAIRTFTYMMTLEPPPAPARACSGATGAEHALCCINELGSLNASAECLAGTDLSAPAARLTFALGLYSLMGAELAKTSRLVGVSEDFGPTLRSGGTYLVWRGPAADGTFAGDRLLLTELNADLVARLARTLDLLLPKMREARGNPPPYPNTLRCDANGFSVVNFDWAGATSTEAHPFAITPPDPVAIRRPPSSPAAMPTTLEIRAESSTSFFRLAPTTTCGVATRCADGTTNNCLFRGLREFSRFGLDPFGCVATPEGQSVARRHHQLNDRDTATIFFHGMYVLGMWRAEGLNPP